MVDMQVRLISEKKSRDDKKKQYRQVQGKLQASWAEYIAGELSAKRLLARCAHIVCPSTS